MPSKTQCRFSELNSPNPRVSQEHLAGHGGDLDAIVDPTHRALAPSEGNIALLRHADSVGQACYKMLDDSRQHGATQGPPTMFVDHYISKCSMTLALTTIRFTTRKR